MAILQEYAGSNDDFSNVGTSAPAYGQSFQLQTDATVTSVSIYGGKGTVGTQPGTLKAELLSGSFTGTVIATTNSFSSSVMADYTPTPAWYEFVFASPVALTANTTYWIKLTALTGSTNDVFRWSSDTTSPTYSLGSRWNNDGTASTNADGNFRVNSAATNSGFFAFM